MTAAIETPCPLCRYPFDQDLLGVHGCPNCEGEGLHVHSATRRAADSIRYIVRELFADLRHAFPYLLVVILVSTAFTAIITRLLSDSSLARILCVVASMVLAMAIPSRASRDRRAVKKHTKNA